MLGVQFSGTNEHTSCVVQVPSLALATKDYDSQVQENPEDNTHHDMTATDRKGADESNAELQKDNQSRETPSGEGMRDRGSTEGREVGNERWENGR